MSCYKSELFCKILRLVTLLVCIILFLVLSWKLVEQYASGDTVKSESSEDIGSLTPPIIAICPNPAYLDSSFPSATKADYMKNTHNVTSLILTDLGSDYEVKEFFTLNNGRCATIRYKKMVSH